MSRKLVWSVGTAKAGRSLQTFILFHYKFAVGVTPTSLLNHVRNLDVDSSSTGILCLIMHLLQTVIRLKVV